MTPDPLARAGETASSHASPGHLANFHRHPRHVDGRTCPHHLDGPNALAFARSRKAAGESDFTRAARQQQILLALRDKVTSGGNLLFQLPGLLDAVGRTIRSDVPVDKLPALAAIMEEISHRNVVSAVIRFPLVHPKSTRYGDAQEPDLRAILAVAAGLFPAPGTPPKGWTPPK